MKSREPLANRQVIDLPDVRLVSFSLVRVCGRQIIKELQEVAFVIAQGVRAHVALVAQVVEELSEKLIDHADTSRNAIRCDRPDKMLPEQILREQERAERRS